MDTKPQQDATPEPAAAKMTGRDIVAVIFRFQSLFGLVLVFLGAVIFSPSKDGELIFLSATNLFDVVRAVSEIGIIAVGMTLVILIGGIDLSVGSMLGFSSVMTAVLLINKDYSLVV